MISSKSRCAILPSSDIDNKAATRAVASDRAAPHQVDEQHMHLAAFLSSVTVPMGRIASSSSTKKLARLTIGQLNELLVDLCDEITRRQRDGEGRDPFLAIRLEYSPKRNQARQKLADLSEPRFVELVASVNFELENRFPDLKGETNDNGEEATKDHGFHGDVSANLSSLDKQFENLSKSLASMPEFSAPKDCPAPPTVDVAKLMEASTTSGHLSTALTTPNTEKSLPEPLAVRREPAGEAKSLLKNQQMAASTSAIDDHHTMTLRSAKAASDSMMAKSSEELSRAAKVRTRNFDCLDSLLAELNVMIGKEQSSEMEVLRGRHNQEVTSLKEYIGHLEEDVISAKNHEIARLAAGVEDLEAKLSVIRQEHATAAKKLAEREEAFQEQATLLENIQSAYIQLQKQLSHGLRSPKGVSPSETTTSGFGGGSINSPSLSSYNAEIFSALWAAYSRTLEASNRAFENRDASLSDKLVGIKDACAVAQRLVKDVERLLSRLERERMPWLTVDVDSSILAKSQCMQALSYCIVSCKDAISGQVKGDREVRDALLQLTRSVRGLVDAAELVASRAQVPPIQQTSGSSLLTRSAGNLAASSPLEEAGERLQGLLKGKADHLLSTFHSLCNFIESQYKATNSSVVLVSLSSTLRSQVSEALAHLVDVIQMGRQTNMSSTIDRQLTQLEDAVRKLQLVLLNGSVIISDEASQLEVLNASNMIVKVLQQLQNSPSQ